ncbi:MAG TPA: hypothetical protein PLB33_08895 [Sedimentibacter sp.]|nr:hypothetical protein [Sedimentibacter sp.]
MGIIKILKKVSGIQAYQDRREASNIKTNADSKYEDASQKTEQLRESLNGSIQEFGRMRLESLKSTVGIFISYLKDIEQKNKTSQYDFLKSIDIKDEKIKELESLDMSASKILQGTIASTAIGAAAVAGVPTAITGAVTALATASTGTAISSLSGVAASNAVLAWLGGGTLAMGGGGVAAGAAVLTAATWTVTGGLAVLTAGLIASAHYSKKLTEAKEYEKEVDIRVAEMEKAWVVMEGIEKRIEELKDVTHKLSSRTVNELKYLTPLIPDFDSTDIYYKEVFQKTGLLIKAMGELAKTALFGEDGNLSESSGLIVGEVQSLLNTQL